MRQLKEFISHIYRAFFGMIALIFPVVPHTVLFESFNGKLPGDSPYAVYRELQRQHPEWQLVWGVKARYYREAVTEYPDVRFMKRFGLAWLWFAPRAQYWLFNARFPYWLRKNKGTTYIQTWHGTPLKKLGIDIETVTMPGITTADYHNHFVRDSHRWDYLVAQNPYSQTIFTRAFDFRGQFLQTGYPRNDVLVQHRTDADYQRRLREQLVGGATGRVIMYAPTWRDDNFVRVGEYKLNLPFDLDRVAAQLGPDDAFIIRPHYLVADSLDVSAYPNIYVLATADINELYLISDALITDYSSVMFDYALMNRPMLFFPYDQAHYADDTRGFYFDYSQVPGPIVRSDTEFYAQLGHLLAGETTPEQVTTFRNDYCPWDDGHAAANVVAVMTDSQQPA